MESTVNKGTTSEVTPEKRPYRRPELRRVGTVAELTLTAGTSPHSDSAPLSTSKVSP
jgi:hypothetical protein